MAAWETRAVVAAIALLAIAPSGANATDGYFQIGYGARQKALGGAGAADSRDATAASLNPAGIINAPSNELDIAVSLFDPRREMTGSGGGGNPGFAPQGTVQSGNNYFLVPNLAWATRTSNPFFDAFAVTVYGNGGMDTKYPDFGRAAPQCFNQGGQAIGTRTGVFCGGTMGVSLQQMFISAAFAKQIMPGVSIGVAPILARQQIELNGLGAFTGLSIDPSHVSGQGTDVSWGGGARAGVEITVAPNVRLGVAGNSRIMMQSFEAYRGLFAEHGSFDIPASIQAGLAVDMTPAVTLMADYKHIWYSSVKAIANPSSAATTCAAGLGAGQGLGASCLGQDGGPGFGWRDVDVFKFGVEWRTSPSLVLRAGYSHNTNPIKPADVMFNIIAPGVVTDHVTAGLQYRISQNMDLELAGMYVPKNTVSGTELATVGNPAHNIDISMHQYEVTAGIKYRFGDTHPPLK